MKTLSLILLIGLCCVPAVPQSTSLNSSLAELAHQTDQINLRFRDINQKIAIRNKIDDEYYAMTLELMDLADPRVQKIIDGHLAKIDKLAEGLKK